MAAGQGVLSVAADDAALAVLETRLEVQETARAALHASQLRTMLDLSALCTGRGSTLSTVPHAALVLGCSEHRAGLLLTDAQSLVVLPGGLEALECGLLTVEQSATVVKQLAVLPMEARLVVWRRLQQRLIAEADAGSVLPPARLGELLRRWVIQADPEDAVARRRRAEKSRQVDYRLRPDGLGDLFGSGFRAPDLHAILSRIAARSAPWGAADDRTADQRRFDAFRDLLLGRVTLPAGSDQPDGHDHAGSAGVAGCGCRPGKPVPCGAEIAVFVPLGGALRTTDEPAELAGHGPLEPDLLEKLLLNAPRLRPVWVDGDGVPVAVGSQVLEPRRDDPESVREALQQLADLPPRPLQPQHPHDHPTTPHTGGGGGGGGGEGGGGDADGSAQHPPDTPGAYRPPRWLRRLVTTRAPRCEWPGCGARAVRCDAEHDDAWPGGPTCACNLGPCCRRHHQVKQQGWIKTRTPDGVRWTGRTGRSWLSPRQHAPVTPPVRSLPPVATPSPLDQLSPAELEDELAALDLLPDDNWTSHTPPVDLEPDDSDRLGRRVQQHDNGWTLDLSDPYRWLEPERIDAQ